MSEPESSKLTSNEKGESPMTIPASTKMYPRTGDSQTIYLKNAVQNPDIEIGEFTIYNDFVNDPLLFAPSPAAPGF